MGPDMRWYKSTSLLCACKNTWRRHPEQGECWCEEGWGKLPGSSKCSQQSTQASCPEGQIVRETGSFLPPKYLPISNLKSVVTGRRCTKLDIHEAVSGIENERNLREKVKHRFCDVIKVKFEKLCNFTLFQGVSNLNLCEGGDIEADPLWAPGKRRVLQNPSRFKFRKTFKIIQGLLFQPHANTLTQANTPLH